MSWSAPAPLTHHHNVEGFSSGEASLDQWLKQRALQNQNTRVSRTYVTCRGDLSVVAYYALASANITHATASGRLRRNMPDPIPVVVLARLAIDREYQGQGLGRELVQDAARRVVAASDIIGIRGLITHAISDEARHFYLRMGFEPSVLEPRTLMMTLGDIIKATE